MPSKTLLWIAGLVVVPVFGAMTFVPGLRPLLLLGLLVLAVVCVLDLLVSMRVLAGVAVEAPERLHATAGRDFEIPLRFTNRSGTALGIRVGLGFGDAFRPNVPILEVQLGKAKAITRRTWVVTALRRGKYGFAAVYSEALSRFGLWDVRRELPVAIEVRVYPDLRSERHGLAAFFLRRGAHGMQPRPQLGKGREFEQLREYAPGDDYGDIFWKGTARRGYPTTKMFQVERTQEVYVVIDHSRLSGREIRVPVRKVPGITEKQEFHVGGEFTVTTQLEKYLQAALILGTVAEQQADLFGLITFSDQVDHFVRSKNGRQHFDSCRDAIYALQPELVSPNYDELIIFIRKHLTRRALIIVLTDLSDPVAAESFYEMVQLVSRQHLVLVNMIRPEAALPVFSSEAAVATTRDLYDRLNGHFHWSELQEIDQMLRSCGVQFALPESGELTLDTVNHYMRIKSRQLL
ncbi:MAG: DUF58 domain-containing protein [Verrucomicrobiae bacterium]|nr:DUF58 domain-containing protein [Verrucomicrobiae bacterium]